MESRRTQHSLYFRPHRRNRDMATACRRRRTASAHQGQRHIHQKSTVESRLAPHTLHRPQKPHRGGRSRRRIETHRPTESRRRVFRRGILARQPLDHLHTLRRQQHERCLRDESRFRRGNSRHRQMVRLLVTRVQLRRTLPHFQLCPRLQPHLQPHRMEPCLRQHGLSLHSPSRSIHPFAASPLRPGCSHR